MTATQAERKNRKRSSWGQKPLEGGRVVMRGKGTQRPRSPLPTDCLLEMDGQPKVVQGGDLRAWSGVREPRGPGGDDHWRAGSSCWRTLGGRCRGTAAWTPSGRAGEAPGVWSRGALSKPAPLGGRQPPGSLPSDVPRPCPWAQRARSPGQPLLATPSDGKV
ncbi:uncharacterized protein LOC106995013 [Macaca mulatta]